MVDLERDDFVKALGAAWTMLQLAEVRAAQSPDDADVKASQRWLAKVYLNMCIAIGADQPEDWQRCGLHPPSLSHN